MNDREPIPNQCPDLVVRIAVTGHRDIDSANEPEIRASVRAIVEQAIAITGKLASSQNSENKAYSPAPPVLRILSSLAEGADRIVAEEALAFKDRHAVTLECPLPATREEYANDFKTPESRDEFVRLLQNAEAVFELDGRREGEWLRASDYGRAGRIAVNNCDLLIAIWDGNPGNPGGTGEIVREAMRTDTPVLRIDVHDPRLIAICAGHDRWECEWQAALEHSLVHALRPPKTAAEWVERYHDETLPAGANEDMRADLLATRYGNRYRASYRAKYGLAALAVLFAVASLMPAQQKRQVWPAAELASILGILLCFLLARTGQWHERWLDYRLLAEQFRVMRFLGPLGETVPVFHAPRYWGVPTERHSCVRWYFQARLREHGIPDARVTDDYVRQRRADVLAVAREQLKYNTKKHASAKLGHGIMEWAGVLLFVATGVACIAHLLDWGTAVVLGALTATLPAFGAAMQGLEAQEEGKRIAGYSGAMAKNLEEVGKRIEALPEDAGLGVISSIAFELATEMTRETSGWHNLIHGQPPKV